MEEIKTPLGSHFVLLLFDSYSFHVFRGAFGSFVNFFFIFFFMGATDGLTKHKDNRV